MPYLILIIVILGIGCIVLGLGWQVSTGIWKRKYKYLQEDFKDWKSNARDWQDHRDREHDKLYQKMIDKRDYLLGMMKSCPRCCRKLGK